MKSEKKPDKYTQELEEKIFDLSLKIKNKSNEFNTAIEINSKILSKLTHNLKNPVGVIFSFSEMMLEDLEGYSHEKLEKHLQIIKNSATFSLALLDTISKYTRIQSPNFVLKSQRINYTELLSTLINELELESSKKNIDMVVKLPKNDIFLTVDGAEITQALTAILKNALRYSNENSIITITVSELENIVETTITDQGIGISETDLPNIFEEFYVVNTYSADKQKCVGLGLAIARKIAELHNGKISAKSALNKGTRFKLSLPKN
ncbi:MAG: HAMP domain-containing sensor histidine kinase [Lutibacter sp.]|nr:HAMP domain-containing sensor histidine kinase [Lutibacter sp.]